MRLPALVGVLCLSAALIAPSPAEARQRKAPPPLATVETPETQAAISPAQAVQRLKEGNARFVSGQLIERDLLAQVRASAGGQAPFAVVLGCIDSRVPPELVFDQGIGDIFAPRIAGNFVNTDILGSMEFATAVAGARAIVVLGHTSCGAVMGVCGGVEMGNLTHTLGNIAPAVHAVSGERGERPSTDAGFVEAVAEENVRMTVANIVERSAVLAELVDEERLVVVGAIHDVSTGEVRWLDDTMLASD